MAIRSATSYADIDSWLTIADAIRCFLLFYCFGARFLLFVFLDSGYGKGIQFPAVACFPPSCRLPSGSMNYNFEPLLIDGCFEWVGC